MGEVRKETEHVTPGTELTLAQHTTNTKAVAAFVRILGIPVIITVGVQILSISIRCGGRRPIVHVACLIVQATVTIVVVARTNQIQGRCRDHFFDASPRVATHINTSSIDERALDLLDNHVIGCYYAVQGWLFLFYHIFYIKPLAFCFFISYNNVMAILPVQDTSDIVITVTIKDNIVFEYAEPVVMALQPGVAANTEYLHTGVTTNNQKGFAIYAKALKGTYTLGGISYNYQKAPALEFTDGAKVYTLPAISGTSSLASGDQSGWGLGCGMPKDIDVTPVNVECISEQFIGLTLSDKMIAKWIGAADSVDVGLVVGATASPSQVAGTYRGVVQLTAMINE